MAESEYYPVKPEFEQHAQPVVEPTPQFIQQPIKHYTDDKSEPKGLGKSLGLSTFTIIIIVVVVAILIIAVIIWIFVIKPKKGAKTNDVSDDVKVKKLEDELDQKDQIIKRLAELNQRYELYIKQQTQHTVQPTKPAPAKVESKIVEIPSAPTPTESNSVEPHLAESKPAETPLTETSPAETESKPVEVPPVVSAEPITSDNTERAKKLLDNL